MIYLWVALGLIALALSVVGTLLWHANHLGQPHVFLEDMVRIGLKENLQATLFPDGDGSECWSVVGTSFRCRYQPHRRSNYPENELPFIIEKLIGCNLRGRAGSVEVIFSYGHFSSWEFRNGLMDRLSDVEVAGLTNLAMKIRLIVAMKADSMKNGYIQDTVPSS